MKLSRARSQLVAAALFLVAGIVVMWASRNGWELRVLFIPVGSTALFILGLLAALGGAAGLAVWFRGAPITLNESGLELRVAGINGPVPWAAVDAVILEPPADAKSKPRLVLVPAAGVQLKVKAEYQNMVDQRPSVILLGLDSLRASQEQVIEAFTRYAGPRFVNGLSRDGLAAA